MSLTQSFDLTPIDFEAASKIQNTGSCLEARPTAVRKACVFDSKQIRREPVHLWRVDEGEETVCAGRWYSMLCNEFVRSVVRRHFL